MLRLPLLLLAALTLTACPSDSEEDLLEASTKELTLENGQAQVTIKSNTAWNVTQLPSWVSCSSMGGSGDMLLRLTETQKNPNTTERTETMTVKCAGSATKVDIKITQPGTPLPDDEITVSTRSVSFDAAQGTYTLVIRANNLWSFTLDYESDDKDWLTLSLSPETQQRDKEKQMEIKAAANTSINPRSAELTFTCGTTTPVKVKISQAKASAMLKVKPDNISLDSDGNSNNNTFTVESNVEWTVKSSEAWCTLEIDGAKADSTYQGNKEVTVKAEKYGMPDADRHATITVTGEGNTLGEVMVTQKAATRSIEVTAVSPIVFTAEKGETKTFQITANTPWTITVSDDSWLSVTPKGGEGDGSTVTINVTTTEENKEAKARPTATITIRATGIANDKVIDVIQEGAGPMLTVAPKSLSFGPKSGQQTFEITSNISWFIEASDSWFTPSVTKGERNQTITVKVSDNTQETGKEGSITIKGEGMTETITIMQEGIRLTVDPNEITFAKNGGEQTINVTCNSDWSTENLPQWCQVKKQSDSSLTIKAEANPSIKERDATFTVRAGNVTREIKVHQEAQIEPGAEDNPLPGGYSRKTK